MSIMSVPLTNSESADFCIVCADNDQAIALKQQCDRAVAADTALQQTLADLSAQFREEALCFGALHSHPSRSQHDKKGQNRVVVRGSCRPSMLETY